MNANDRGAEGAGSLVTDLANEKPEQQNVPPKAAPAQEAPKGNTTPPPVLPNWTTSASKETRADPRFVAYASKHESLDAALKASIELEEKLGSMVAIPGKDATEEERSAVYEKLGIKLPDVPKDPAGYKIEADPKMKVDAKELDEFKALAHSLHMTQEQAQGMFKLAGERAMKAIEAFNTQTAEERKGVETQLRKEWGEQYEAQRAVFVRGLRAAPGSQELIADAAKTGMGNKASFVRLIHWIGTMQQEDKTATRAPAGGAKTDAAATLYPNMKG